MTVSLVVPIHNSASTLKKVLDSIERQEHPLTEVFLIDNNSSDSSFHIMEVYQKSSKFKVKLIRQTVDKGLAHSYNEAIRAMETDFVITLQSDCVINESDGISRLLKPFSRDNEIVASCSLQKTPWGIWEEYDFWQKCLFSRHAGKVASGRNGRFCCFKTKSLKKIGLFNERKYRTAGEDGDLFIRLEKVGNVVDVNDLVVDHLHSRSKNFSLGNYIYKENQLAEATGACLANNLKKVSLLNYKTVLLRPVLLIGLLVPKVNLVFLILILAYSVYITSNVFKKEWKNYRILLLPVINIFLLLSFNYFFFRGFVTKRQAL